MSIFDKTFLDAEWLDNSLKELSLIDTSRKSEDLDCLGNVLGTMGSVGRQFVSGFEPMKVSDGGAIRYSSEQDNRPPDLADRDCVAADILAGPAFAELIRGGVRLEMAVKQAFDIADLWVAEALKRRGPK